MWLYYIKFSIFFKLVHHEDEGVDGRAVATLRLSSTNRRRLTPPETPEKAETAFVNDILTAQKALVVTRSCLDRTSSRSCRESFETMCLGFAASD